MTKRKKTSTTDDSESGQFLYILLKREWAFVFDFLVYLLAVITASKGFDNFPLDETFLLDPERSRILETYIKPCWVWKMLAFVITLGWINLLCYLRQIYLGKYIIILNDIIYTFVSFVTIFAIFIISFTFGFHVLLYSQGDFQEFMTFKDSFMKTMIMMSGEFDYGGIFYPDGAPGPPFPNFTYAFFIIFFILLALILLNLLVGLSVSDVTNFVELAELKKMSLRLKFVLDTESFLNSFIGFQLRKIIFFIPNKKIGTLVEEEEQFLDVHEFKMWKQVVVKKKENEIDELKEHIDYQNVQLKEHFNDLLQKEKKDRVDQNEQLKKHFYDFLQKEKSDRSTGMDNLSSQIHDLEEKVGKSIINFKNFEMNEWAPETCRTVQFINHLGNFKILIFF